MSFSVMVNFLGLGLLILFVPRLTVKFGDGKECSASDGAHGNCPGQANLLFFFT